MWHKGIMTLPPEPYRHAEVTTPQNVEEHGRDYTEWLMRTYPWYRLNLRKLHVVKRQERGLNWWRDKEVLGDLHIHLYVRVRASLVRTHNILVIYDGLTMLILKDANAVMTRHDKEGEEIAYYDWMGS